MWKKRTKMVVLDTVAIDRIGTGTRGKLLVSCIVHIPSDEGVSRMDDGEIVEGGRNTMAALWDVPRTRFASFSGIMAAFDATISLFSHFPLLALCYFVVCVRS